MVTRSRSRATSLIALLSVVLLLATACGDDDVAGQPAEPTEEGGATTTTAPAEGATTTTAAAEAPAEEDPPSESPASSLRSDLVALLQEQVYLTGFVVEEALAAEPGPSLDAPVAAAAVTAAGESATELSEVLGAAYGVAAGTDFLAAWNDHREAIVAYGVDDGAEGAIDTAREGVLDALAEIDADADFSAVGDALEESDTALISTVDDLIAEEPGAAADLRAAAEPLPDAALALVTAITDRIATEGEVDSPEAELRAELTALIQESVLLTGLGLAETVQAGGDASAPGPAGVLDAVADNSQELGDALEPDDEDAADEFAGLWDDHIAAFEAYTTALVDDDAEGLESSQDALVTFRDDLGELLAERYPAFTQEQVAEELVDHTDSLLAYVDASVREAGDLADDVEETNQLDDAPSEAPGLLREASLAGRLAARTLARGVTATAPE